MNVPIYEQLLRHHRDGRISFAMPGHKNGRGLQTEFNSLDVTELDTTLNLRSWDDPVAGEAMKLLAELYGSDESYILTCGSTAGIQAMLSSALRPGDTLLISGDCHMSVINTCALCGYKVAFIDSEIDEETLISRDKDDIAKVIARTHTADAVLVTSPNYYGFCRDIEKIAQACHERDIPLLVDEAHGAHFIASDALPKSAISCGADAAVNSAHKTLNALTGAAYLHVKSNLIDKPRLKQALGMFQTSSPSYPIAASADIARAELEDSDAWDRVIGMCEEFRKIIADNTLIRVIKNDDPTRIVLNFFSFEATGYEVGRQLSENYKIDVEMSDVLNVVLIATPSNTREDFDRLLDALYKIHDNLGVRRESISMLPPPEHPKHINPQRAFYSNTQLIPLEKSLGRVSAATVTAYPPGIPILYMGEEISSGILLYIRHLLNRDAKFTGFDGKNLLVMR